MEKFEAPIELDDVELDAVAGGIFNDINLVFAVVVLNSRDVDIDIEDSSTSDTDIPPVTM
jgi:hypothetical protein